MSFFAKLCRNTGLMVHHAVKPLRSDKAQRREIRRTVEEEQRGPGITLRRTTIEEVEVKPDESHETR